MSGLRLFARYVGTSVRAQLQYRASFAMLALGQFLITLVEFAALALLLERFGQIRGWRLPEVAVFYGLVSVAFALAEGAARGFDNLPSLVKSGGFDRVLLRPRPAALQVAGHELQLLRVGRLAQGLVVLGWAVHALGTPWRAWQWLLAAWTVAGGACLFYGLLVLQATTAFWTVESLELWNIVTYGGVEAAQFPLTIYRDWFRRVFTWVVPLGCIAWLPGCALLGRLEAGPRWWLVAAPGVGFVFLAASLAVWQVGVRHYTSTGS